MSSRLLLTAAVLLLAPPAEAQTQVQGLASARVFVAGLYRGYAHGQPDYLGRDAPRVFAPDLLALIRQDARQAAGEVGALDGDPICDCQDAGGLRLERLEVTPAGTGRATARVWLRYPSERRAMTLDLAAVDGRWRVSDVHTKETPSLLVYLRKSVPLTSPGRSKRRGGWRARGLLSPLAGRG